MNWLNNLFTDKETKQTPRKAHKKAAPKPDKISPGKPVSIDKIELSLDILRNFIPLRSLNENILTTLPYTIKTYKPDSVIFALGDTAESIQYLLEGEIEIQPDSDYAYQVSADSIQAHLPLNSGKKFGATAHAIDTIKILDISADLTNLWTTERESVSCVELVDIELPDQISGNRFFDSFAQAYRENKLQLPSMPTVALKLKEALQKDIGVTEAVEIIQLDAPIVTQLIQIVNSPLYSPVTPITNCHDAVTRLGLEATRNLVMGISLKKLFKCKDPQLMRSMQALWKNSLFVSSLSFVLAEESGTVNPEDALLAGLVSDIGIIPLLNFAEQYPDEYPDPKQLHAAIPYLRAPVGSLVLHTLGFPDKLSNIPHHAEDWFYESGDQLTLIDIIILAKLHGYFGTQKSTGLPYINSIPAYSKLKDGKLNPDFSLAVLKRAHNRVKAAMSIFL